MNETQARLTEKKTEVSKVNTDTGDKPKAFTLVDEANQAAERLERANERQTELLRQQEEIQARDRLGGRSDAGQTQEKPQEIDPREYAKLVLKGIIPLK